MRKTTIMAATVAVSMALGGAALAQSQDNSGFNNHHNTQNNTTNNDNRTINRGGNGGAGGAGGAGGTGVGVGVGVGLGGNASATGGNADATAVGVQGQQQGIFDSGNSSNTNNLTNENTNTNVGVNEQRQGQGQDQSQGQGQSQTGVNVQGQSTDNANNSNQNVTVEGDNYEAPEIPVASARAAGLAAGANTCMGSTSGGMQSMNFGFSVGSTWNDSKCDTRMDASTLMGMGLDEAAVARICQDGDMRAAIEATGKQCPGQTQEEEAERVASASTSASGDVLREDAPAWCSGATATNNARYEQCVE